MLPTRHHKGQTLRFMSVYSRAEGNREGKGEIMLTEGSTW